MRVVQVTRPNGRLEIVEREISQPDAVSVRVKIEACGICHSDAMTKEGLWPGIQYPRVPGHEVAGIIDAIGAGVAGWTKGQRVGTGWHGGHCGYCDSCRRGDFVTCQVAAQVPGISYDGGYAEYMTVAFTGAKRKRLWNASNNVDNHDRARDHHRDRRRVSRNIGVQRRPSVYGTIFMEAELCRVKEKERKK